MLMRKMLPRARGAGAIARFIRARALPKIVTWRSKNILITRALRQPALVRNFPLFLVL